MWSVCILLLGRGRQTFVKGQIVNILSFAGYMVSAKTSQVWHSTAKAAIDNMQASGHNLPQ